MEYEVPKPSHGYFFIDGSLYKVIKIVKTRDEVVAWSFKDAKRVLLSWVWLQKTKEYAFTMKDTAILINRPVTRIKREAAKGTIPLPHRPYSLKTGKLAGRGFYSESAILEIHEEFSKMHKGKPRKDGIKAPAPMPTRMDLINMMQHQLVTYVKNGDSFVPIWKAGTW